MNALLTRLGVDAALQDWLSPHYHTDLSGNLCFSYRDTFEVYGLSFHRVPVSNECWLAGPDDPVFAQKVIVCNSAMEAIAWLNCHFPGLSMIDNVVLVATGTRFNAGQFIRIRQMFPRGKYALIFGNDLVGRIFDLKAAALLCGYAAQTALTGDHIQIKFRTRTFCILSDAFSLNAFERLSGFRFHVKTLKPARHSSWLNQLLAQNINISYEKYRNEIAAGH